MNVKTKEWAKFELECLLLLIFINSYSKFKVTCKKADFECRYIRTHTKEKPSKISNIAFAILTFYQKNTQTEWPPWVIWSLLLLMKPSDVLKMVHFNIKIQNLELVEFKCACNFHTTHSSVLKDSICHLLCKNKSNA